MKKKYVLNLESEQSPTIDCQMRDMELIIEGVINFYNTAAENCIQGSARIHSKIRQQYI